MIEDTRICHEFGQRTACTRTFTRIHRFFFWLTCTYAGADTEQCCMAHSSLLTLAVFLLRTVHTYFSMNLHPSVMMVIYLVTVVGKNTKVKYMFKPMNPS